MADVSEKLTRIDTSVANIRTFLGLTEANTIEEIATKVKDVSQNNSYIGDITKSGNMQTPAIVYSIKTLDEVSIKTTDPRYLFANLNNLEEIKAINFNGLDTPTEFFYQNNSLKKIGKFLNAENLTRLSFGGCLKLVSIPEIDTTKFTFLSFNNCREITDLPLYNAENFTNCYNMFNQCYKLVNFGGLKNLGQAYDISQPENYQYYTLALNNSSALTHESLMNVINNLYDIASKGCNPQKLILGNTLLAKLTSEEIAIATNKGWTVS